MQNAPASGDAPPANTPPQDPPAVPPAIPANMISLEDHRKQMDKARTEEKNKLYGDLTAAQTKATEAEKRVVDLTAQLQVLKASVKDGGIDTAALVKEVTDASRAHAQSEIAALQAKISELEKKNTESDLMNFRRQKIAEAGGEDTLIPALVHGNTKEEIEASVTRAKAVFEQTKAQVLAGIAGTTTQHANGANQPPQSPPALPNGAPNGNPGNAGGVKLESVKNMSMKDYRTHRESLLKQSAGRYPGV